MRFRNASSKPTPKSLRQRLQPTQNQSRKSVAQTFSYHTQRSDQTVNTGRKFRQEILNPAARNFGGFWLQRFGLGVLLIAGVICLISLMSLSNSVKLQQLGPINRSSLFHNQNAYQNSARELLSASLLNHNKVTINTEKLSKQLLVKYPELASATVTIPIVSHRPIVYISYTQPAIIVHNQTGSFVLDTDGKVLIATNSEAINLGLPSVTDQSGFKLAPSSQVLSSSDVAFIQTIVAGLGAKHITVSSMTLPPAASELDVVIAGTPYFVKFNLHAPSAKLQVGSFLAVQSRLQGEGITPASYIDVRVNGRAYYK